MEDNKIQLFNNENLKMKVRAIQNEDGSISVNAEDVARGYGWIQNKSGKEYLRFDRMNQYIEEIVGETSPQVGKDDFIPESVFYMLGMKAKNSVAQEFQKWLSMEVLPSIRKTGSYITTKSEEPKMLGSELVDKLDGKLSELGMYYKPTHKRKIEMNRYIKSLLVKNARENCDKVKDILLVQLGYDIYDDVPINILHSKEVYNRVYDICKIINNQDGAIQTSLF